jgi:hypothetical protein
MKTIKGYFPLILLSLLIYPWLTGCSSESTSPITAVPLQGTVSNVSATVPSPPPLDSQVLETIEPAPQTTSPGIDEVIKLAKSGVDEAILVSFIENSPVAYDPSAQEILYLTDIGVSSRIISAMLKHGRQLRDQQAQNAPQVAQSEPAPAPAAEPVASAQVVSAPEAPPTTVEQPVESAPAVEEAPAPQVVYQAPAEAPQEVAVFYDSLSPYGSWINVAGYGWCWQPTVVSVYPGWSPYCDAGRWLYSDCGWYWQSDYSWGWAPFHYGRWYHHHHRGWVWAPDLAWAPAWVSWRYHEGYCGWAPLPPGACFVDHHGHGGWTYFGVSVGAGFGFGLSYTDYTFVHARYLGDHHWNNYRMPHDRVQTIYNNTVVINNYQRGHNNVIVNGGVGNERINLYRRQPLRPVEVRDVPAHNNQFVKGDRLERSRGQEVIYRKQLQDSIPNRPQITSAQTRPVGNASQPASPNVNAGMPGRNLSTGTPTSLRGREAAAGGIITSPTPGPANNRGITSSRPNLADNPAESMTPATGSPANQSGGMTIGTPRSVVTPASGRRPASSTARMANESTIPLRSRQEAASSSTRRVESTGQNTSTTMSSSPTSPTSNWRGRQEQSAVGANRVNQGTPALAENYRSLNQNAIPNRSVDTARSMNQSMPTPTVVSPSSSQVSSQPPVDHREIPSQQQYQRQPSPAMNGSQVRPSYNNQVAQPSQSFTPRYEAPRQASPMPSRPVVQESRSAPTSIGSGRPAPAPTMAPTPASSSRSQPSSSGNSSRSSQENSGGRSRSNN